MTTTHSHLVHVLFETCQQLVGSSQRFVRSQALIVVSIRSQLKGGAISEDLCSVLIGLQDYREWVRWKCDEQEPANVRVCFHLEKKQDSSLQF